MNEPRSFAPFPMLQPRSRHATDARLFACVYSTGIAYSDRTKEEHGDYKKVAFLSFKTLILEPAKGANKELLAAAVLDAKKIQARKGENFQISSSGQYVTLGE
jgi:hypothetical protein